MRHPWKGKADCAEAKKYLAAQPKARETEAQNLARLTGWKIETIRERAGGFCGQGEAAEGVGQRGRETALITPPMKTLRMETTVQKSAKPESAEMSVEAHIALRTAYSGVGARHTTHSPAAHTSAPAITARCRIRMAFSKRNLAEARSWRSSCCRMMDSRASSENPLIIARLANTRKAATETHA